MEKYLFKRISVRTGLSVMEVTNIFTVTASIIKQDLKEKGVCMIPYIGKYYVKDSKRRRQKIMDFQTKQQKIITVPPRKQIKFECNKIIKSIAHLNLATCEDETLVEEKPQPVKHGPIEIT